MSQAAMVWDRARRRLLRTGRGLLAPVHLVVLSLLVALTLQVRLRDGTCPHGLLLSLVFAAVYALAPEVCRRSGADAGRWIPAREVCQEAVLWLIALTALWLALTVVRMEYETLVAPLYFVYLLVLPARPVYVIGGLTAAAFVMRTLAHGANGSLPMLGLLVGAGMALGLARSLMQIRLLKLRDRALVAELRRVHGDSQARHDEGRVDGREEGRVEERGRMAQDIHDTVAQELSAVAMLLKAADESLPPAEQVEKARTRLRAAATINSVALGQARDMVHGIAYSELGEGGLPAAVGRYVALVRRSLAASEQAWGSAARSRAPRVDCLVLGTPFRLSPTRESAMLRVTQEAVNNALRHAWATRVDVTLRYADGELTLEVRDNGVGLPPGLVAGATRPSREVHAAGEVHATGEVHAVGATGAKCPRTAGVDLEEAVGVGLGAMRDRVRRAGGELALSSCVGIGTVVSVSLPQGAFAPRLLA
ncbi:sensor histidine kinase [Streptacidiphilus sp. MAP5-3]|uniref:sensor histidine kinase n=1 Tax=unclassified Streptacidiphilus TaxID=2643834 RepID=UPI003519AE1D